MTKIITNVKLNIYFSLIVSKRYSTLLVYYCLVVLFPKTVKEKTEKAKPNS